MSRPGDEYDGGPSELPPVQSLTGMDGFFAKTNIVVLVLFAWCCNPVSLILGIIGLLTCTDPRAKQNAMIVTIVAGALAVLGGIGWAVRIGMGGH